MKSKEKRNQSLMKKDKGVGNLEEK